MKNDAGAVILLAILIVSVFLLIVYKLVEYFTAFNRETCRILSEMDRAEDGEYGYWRKSLRCHYLRLIPFVTERNVAGLYDRLYYRPKRVEKQGRTDSLPHLLAPSIVGACICVICLCGTSWAWFTATSSAGAAVIQSATYTATVTAKEAGNESGEVTPAMNGASTVFSNLVSGKDYCITITPGGTSTKGYCEIKLGETVYYTDQLTTGSFSFTVHASESHTVLTVTPKWGTCDNATADNTITSENNEIGEKRSTVGGVTGQNADPAVQTSAPSDEVSTEEVPVASTGADDVTTAAE